MTTAKSNSAPFRTGDQVVLVEGTYQGTPGVFVRLAESDPKWAEITERNGKVRSHPLVWMAHAGKLTFKNSKGA